MPAWSDESAVERSHTRLAQKEEAYRKALRNRAINHLYETREGRELLWWLLEIGNAWGSNPFVGDRSATDFNCGIQAVGQRILAALQEANLDGFVQLLKDQQNVRNSRNTSGGNTSDTFDDAGEPELFSDRPDQTEYN